MLLNILDAQDSPRQGVIGPKCPSPRLRDPVARLKAPVSALKSSLQGAVPDQPAPSHAPSALSSLGHVTAA